MVTPEARPFAKTGGLADVAGALPQALARVGHQVTVILPRYRGIDTSGMTGTRAEVPFGANVYPVTFFEAPPAAGVQTVLIDAPDLFDREGLYGDAGGEYADNGFRYAVLSRGALEYVRSRGRRPSVIHAHDWQAGLVPVYLKTVLAGDPIVGGVRTVLTIHNLAFQGTFPLDLLPWIGLPADLAHPGALEFWGRASALKGGVVFSDAITTVSPTYAKEIATPEFGFGFDGIIASRAADLVGILNGIDADTWNPAADAYVPAPFSADDLSGKAAAKAALLEYVGLEAGAAAIARPLVGLISRLTYQKGFDLIAEAADRLMAHDATWVMLGNGEAWCEQFWQELAVRYPDRVRTKIGFDERLAHLIEAGADLFLMPSRYEPCGLNQMYSLRYGTLPIVRATGGLDDTVIDADAEPRRGTGFKFSDYNSEALAGTVDRALTAYKNARRWKTIQRRAMAEDHSWDVSAREYVKVYEGAPRPRERRATPIPRGRAAAADEQRGH
jgi:starch synthase